jgi:hypothetical protein
MQGFEAENSGIRLEIAEVWAGKSDIWLARRRTNIIDWESRERLSYQLVFIPPSSRLSR